MKLLPLGLEAKRLWVACCNRHRSALLDLDDDLQSAAAKLEAYAARLPDMLSDSSEALRATGTCDAAAIAEPAERGANVGSSRGSSWPPRCDKVRQVVANWRADGNRGRLGATLEFGAT